jgi:lipooligosaccharide transport system ATP-binding protein
MTSTAAPAVVAERLEKRYGKLWAVRGIDFTIESGERFGVLGPNGAGKSSTMKMLYGRTAISGGRLSVLGLDVARHTLQVKRLLGVVPQENNLDPDLTVRENLVTFARFYGYDRADAERRAAAGLERADLAAFAKARPDELSGGMKRRLIIARALLHAPQLVVLDEPTTGLDPRARHVLWQQLEQLAATGVTLVLTTHYMDEAARLCSRLIAMDHGRILTEGSPDRIVAETVGNDVVEWPAARWRPEWEAPLAGPTGPLHRALAVGSAVYLCGDGDALVRALATLAGDDTHISPQPRVRPATLEDAFLALSGHDIADDVTGVPEPGGALG